MSGAGSLSGAAGAGRDGSQWLVLVILLHGLGIAFAALCGIYAFPLPEEQWRIAAAEFRPDGGETGSAAAIVSLPHNWLRRDGSPEAGRYLIPLDAARNVPPAEDLAIFIPRFTYRIDVAVNGIRIATSRTAPTLETIVRNTSLLVVVPSIVLKPEGNSLELRLETRGVISGFLDAVYVGPAGALQRAHEQRTAIFIHFPIFIALFSLFMSALLAIFWIKRRTEPAYGLLALGLGLNALHSLGLMPGTSFYNPSLHTALHALPMIETAATCYAVGLMFGHRLQVLKLMALAGIGVFLLGLFGELSLFARVMTLFGVPAVGLAVGATFLLCLRIAVRQRQTLALMLSFCCLLTLLLWAHDLLVILNVFAHKRILLVRLLYPVFTSVMATLLFLRLMQTLDAADASARMLAVRVREAEDALRTSFERDREHLQAQALAAERARLMRDLHDGVGGQLVSIVASSERAEADPRQIAEAARQALRDMRLVIDAMDDVDGDLMLVLASWRERLESQLRGAEIDLVWTIGNDTGLPIFSGLRPMHVLAVLRILEEGVTNVVKHAGARVLEVALETVVENDVAAAGRIRLRDDGRGGVTERRSGRGLANMRRRAAAIGAMLAIRSGEGGTEVQLDIPTVLPQQG